MKPSQALKNTNMNNSVLPEKGVVKLIQIYRTIKTRQNRSVHLPMIIMQIAPNNKKVNNKIHKKKTKYLTNHKENLMKMLKITGNRNC